MKFKLVWPLFRYACLFRPRKLSPFPLRIYQPAAVSLCQDAVMVQLSQTEDQKKIV